MSSTEFALVKTNLTKKSLYKTDVNQCQPCVWCSVKSVNEQSHQTSTSKDLELVQNQKPNQSNVQCGEHPWCLIDHMANKTMLDDDAF